ncbi:MAG: GNAT family N-acetyltransferase [endosymbiont of Galathealinum brachiosum]|uniref:GNAT family N-acetyltransferase n=1 Tax=endosymbiont of Galathealinum brachiosum TaxID=2200906 RepID=A0A370D9C9_9GAMM|nr:MAG: GNAT family N-acetyltransferase [endosymbiont of Galathealinum brachiosum]
MDIQYKINTSITTEQFIDLLKRSTLAERRPVNNYKCMQGMINNSNLIVSAWDKDKLIGIARSISDFHYVCYLSDLAIDKEYQKKGIGLKLQIFTQEQLGPECKLILISAPDANPYYKHIGYMQNERCWVLNSDKKLK